MDTADVHELVEDLTSNLDDLEESLAPLLNKALSHSTSKLPLLDKAKLYVLATYAIESVLFSSLRLNGVDAKTHPVFQEIARVKEYFAKIKAAETAGTMRSTTLDKEAASRFIKHDLSGNEKYDRQRAERMAKEKAGPKRKLEDMSVGTYTRFDGVAKKIKATESLQNNEASTATTDAETREDEPAKRKSKNKRARRTEENSSEGQVLTGERDSEDVIQGSAEVEAGTVRQRSQKAPKTSQEALNALLDGSAPSSEPKTSRKKRNRPKSKTQALEDRRADDEMK